MRHFQHRRILVRIFRIGSKRRIQVRIFRLGSTRQIQVRTLLLWILLLSLFSIQLSADFGMIRVIAVYSPRLSLGPVASSLSFITQLQIYVDCHFAVPSLVASDQATLS